MQRTLTLKLDVTDDADYADAVKRIVADPAVAAFHFTKSTPAINAEVGATWAHTSAREFASRRR